MSERVFHATISYLKIIACLGAGMCFVLMFFISFDPWNGLDAMIWKDLYGTTTLPDIARPAFNLIFLMFTWLSVLTMILLFLVTKYALAKKEKWAYGAVILIGVFWPLGATMITLYTAAWSYFISVAAMTALFLPPVILLYPFFSIKSKSP